MRTDCRLTVSRGGGGVPPMQTSLQADPLSPADPIQRQISHPLKEYPLQRPTPRQRPVKALPFPILCMQSVMKKIGSRGDTRQNFTKYIHY